MSDVDKAITEAAAIAALAREGAVVAHYPFDPHDQDADSLYTLVLGTGQRVESVDLEQRRFAPRDKRGTVQVHTPDALITYARRHIDKDTTTIWADVDGALITVVLNDHGVALADGSDDPGWADHRASLALRRSPEWDAWTALDGKGLSQTALAEFLEEHVQDVAAPDGATLLEVTRTFHASSSGRFKRAENLHSGDVELVYEQTTEATAGTSKTSTVPREFTVALRPYLGHDRVLIRGRFSYRIKDGTLILGFRLLNLDDISRAAVETLVTVVAGALELPYIEGAAPGARR